MNSSRLVIHLANRHVTIRHCYRAHRRFALQVVIVSQMQRAQRSENDECSGFIRADGSSRSACVPRAACAMYDMSTRCLDERRQYHSCGSACPISCSTRNSPRCILPSQCPLLTATVRQNPSNSMTVVADVNKEWLQKNLAGFYSTPGAPTILPHTSHCSDPLKNYLNCGTKCPGNNCTFIHNCVYSIDESVNL
ncbi:hypothetical protein NECAME_09045 [Necator americanus]|uniref:Uncharacterized protein n=1 Tax=Necator americanus TaxID=51031 RepID=W2TFN4_NECAM|nr:hypothetical protein NECAME_09045 [Necator americanus]ETN80653.1 hypothetical protein NECAME_09045 [Necator americanus]